MKEYFDHPDKKYRWNDRVRYKGAGTDRIHHGLIKDEEYTVVGFSVIQDDGEGWLIVMGKPEQFKTSWEHNMGIDIMDIPRGYVFYADHSMRFEIVKKFTGLCAECTNECKEMDKEQCGFYEGK